MKKILLATALIVTPALSFADTGPGCGWGAMLFDGQDGLPANVLAATTNGTLGNQTFGMTSGTAGCDASKPVTTSAADSFLNSNMEKVARDMATGGGEALTTLAGLMGIEDADKAAFYQVTQQNFSKIFKSDAVNSKEVLLSLKAVMQLDSQLVKYVG